MAAAEQPVAAAEVAEVVAAEAPEQEPVARARAEPATAAAWDVASRVEGAKGAAETEPVQEQPLQAKPRSETPRFLPVTRTRMRAAQPKEAAASGYDRARSAVARACERGESTHVCGCAQAS